MLLLFILPFGGVKTEMDKYYERPDWLKGSAYAVLQKQSDYSLFVSALEKSKFFNLVKGQGLCSVFAPDNDAMNAYLKSNNYQNIDAIPEKELNLMVGNHIVQYSYRPSDYMNFRPEGDIEAGEDNKGVYYKHKTYGQEETHVIQDPLTGKRVTIYEREKYIPVLNTNLFKTQGVKDYSYNYSYFFPGKKWEGDDNFYAANAAIKTQMVTVFRPIMDTSIWLMKLSSRCVLYIVYYLTNVILILYSNICTTNLQILLTIKIYPLNMRQQVTVYFYIIIKYYRRLPATGHTIRRTVFLTTYTKPVELLSILLFLTIIPCLLTWTVIFPNTILTTKSPCYSFLSYLATMYKPEIWYYLKC